MQRLVLRALTVTMVLFVVAGPAPAARAAGERFDFRGVIEGFYGPPWPKASRTEFLQWMIERDMNLYIHAPKNDPYQRLRWRQPYPEEEMEQFAAEIGLVQPQGLSWVPSISPGFPLLEAAEEHDEDICFSCEGDFQVLLNKLDPFWNAGADTLMLSFDDVIKISTHPEDATTYGVGDYAYGVMNADLLNRLYSHYAARAAEEDRSFRLITVPADYFGTTTTPYLEGLRSTLRDEVIVMWTGVLVVSPTISCTEAQGFADAIGRKPLLWDNFPVNDYAPYKLMVGPYAGRAPDLPECLRGIVSNPASQVRANRIPLYTVADYLRDPAGYAKEESWNAALDSFAGEHRDILDPFIRNVRSTALDRTESVPFQKRRDAFLEALDGADWPVAHEALAGLLEAQVAAPERLRNEFPDPEFVAELECELALQSTNPDDCQGSWLERLAFNASNGLAATAALVETRPDVTGTIDDGILTGRAIPPATPERAAENVDRLKDLRLRDDGNSSNVHGDRFYFALGPVYAGENRMDDYYDRALARLLLYVAQAPVASRSLSVRVDGEPADTAEDGSFMAPTGGDGEAVVVVTDGVGHETRRIFAVP